MDEDAAHGQITARAAEVYEEFFVPALFGQWSEVLLDAAGVSVGHRLLDVGCGTGVVARAATRRVSPTGRVVGIDPNEAMLGVAGRHPEPVEWQRGNAEALPYGDCTFDRVVSQFAVMFFADRRAALNEIARVLAPGGTIAVATWADVSESPGYAAMVGLLRDVIGDAAAETLKAPFCLGTTGGLRDLVGATFDDVEVTRHDGVARFDSVEAWVHTDIRGWTLADTIDDLEYAELLEAAQVELAPFCDEGGRVTFAAPALIATGQHRR